MKVTVTPPTRPTYTIADMSEELALTLHAVLGEAPGSSPIYDIYVQLDELLRSQGVLPNYNQQR